MQRMLVQFILVQARPLPIFQVSDLLLELREGERKVRSFRDEYILMTTQ